MNILVTGAAGMIGSKLTLRLLKDAALNGTPVDRIKLVDVAPPEPPPGFSGKVETVALDLAAPGEATKLIAERPDVIFHLAAIVSGEAELDFDKGYRINLDATRLLLEAIRAAPDYRPKLVFASSIAVFGAPFPPAIPDDFALTPLTSYGTQKAVAELLLADYARRGFVDGVAIRLPTINVRPGKPNRAASGFFSVHQPRAARGPERRAAGRRESAALARKPARRDRLSPPRRIAEARGSPGTASA